MLVNLSGRSVVFLKSRSTKLMINCSRRLKKWNKFPMVHRSLGADSIRSPKNSSKITSRLFSLVKLCSPRISPMITRNHTMMRSKNKNSKILWGKFFSILLTLIASIKCLMTVKTSMSFLSISLNPDNNDPIWIQSTRFLSNWKSNACWCWPKISQSTTSSRAWSMKLMKECNISRKSGIDPNSTTLRQFQVWFLKTRKMRKMKNILKKNQRNKSYMNSWPKLKLMLVSLPPKRARNK